MHSGYEVIAMLEHDLGEYLGAPYVVCVSSCTAAIKLAVQWCFHSSERMRVDAQKAVVSTKHIGWEYVEQRPLVECPSRTYVSVPISIVNAGAWPSFVDYAWQGNYQLKPLPVWDSARWFTSGMYAHGSYMCHSFHSTKTLGDMAGGCIAHDNKEADAWFRRMRFHGRMDGVDPKDDKGIIVGDDCRMNRDVAVRLLAKLCRLPKHNDPLPNDDYVDLSKLECFR